MHLDQVINVHCTDTDKENKGRVVRMHPNYSTFIIFICVCAMYVNNLVKMHDLSPIIFN